MAKQGTTQIGFDWSMIAFTFILLCIRLYTRISRSASNIPSLSDWFVIAAWLSFTLICACDTVLFVEGFFSNDVSPFSTNVSQKLRVLALKIYYVENVCYLNCVYAVKASVLCLFHEFFPRYMIRTRWCLWFVTGFVILGWLLQFLLSAFWCLPISQNWSLDEKKYCTANDSTFVVVVALAPHFASDLMLYVLPMFVVARLSLPRRQKWGLGFTFSMGFLCIFFASAFLASSYMSEDANVIWPFATLEQTWAIVVACCPALRAWCGDAANPRRHKGSLTSGSRFKGKGNLAAELAADKNDVEVGVLVVEMRDNTQRHEGFSHTMWDRSKFDDKLSVSS